MLRLIAKAMVAYRNNKQAVAIGLAVFIVWQLLPSFSKIGEAKDAWLAKRRQEAHAEQMAKEQAAELARLNEVDGGKGADDAVEAIRQVGIELEEQAARKEKTAGGGISSRASICMAALATKNSWNDSPVGGQTPFGTYTGPVGDFETFTNSKGSIKYQCRVDGAGVYVGSALVGETEFHSNYAARKITYKSDKGRIVINIGFPDGSVEERSFNIDAIERMVM